MNHSTLSKVVDQTFPKLDDPLRTEITQKVAGHILETFKDKVFANDQEGLQALHTMLETESDENKRSEEYGKRIMEKFLTLSKEEQIKIDTELEKELVGVLHRVYKAYV